MSIRGVTVTLRGTGQVREIQLPPNTIDFALGAVCSSLRRQHRDDIAQQIETAYREVIWQPPTTERDSDGKANS